MRMIVEAFKETLELGLQKPDQIVVSLDLPMCITTSCLPGPATFTNPPHHGGRVNAFRGSYIRLSAVFDPIRSAAEGRDIES